MDVKDKANDLWYTQYHILTTELFWNTLLGLTPLHSMCWQKFIAHDFWNICLTCFHCSYSVHLASLPCIHLCLVKLEEWGQRLHWECATSIYIQEKKCREKTWARFSYLHADFEKLWKEMFLFLLLEYLGWVQRKLIPFCVPHGV